MDGAFWVLLLALLIFGTSLLMHRFIEGSWSIARLPLTWFYASWLIGLALLSLPFFKYFESFSSETAAYLSAILLSFSVGSIAAAFQARRSVNSRVVSSERSDTAQQNVSTRLLHWLLVLGLIGTSLVLANAVLGGNLSLSDRLDSSNFAAVRADAMNAVESRIGPLFGPATLMSAIGGLGVAYVFYLRGARSSVLLNSTRLFRLSLLVLTVNLLTGVVGFGSRMFAIFGILVAFFGFMEGRWSIGERLIVKRLKAKDFFLISVTSIVTLAVLWVATTIFLEERVQRQDPQTLLFRTHRAALAPLTYELTRDDKAFQYFMLSLSYLSTPIPTLTFYLDLPESRQPGPFYGEYNFPAIWRWGRRFTFTADAYSWEKARFEIFRPLGDIGFGTNVWSSMARDIIADFGKTGALIFIASIGYFSQRVFDSQRYSPTMRRAGLLVYIRLVLAFAGLVSMLFMAQVYWPLYLAIFMASVSGRKNKAMTRSLTIASGKPRHHFR